MDVDIKYRPSFATLFVTLAPGESLCCTELEPGGYFYFGEVIDGNCRFAEDDITLIVDQVTSVTAVCQGNQD